MEAKESNGTNAAIEATFARLEESLPPMLDRRQAAIAAGMSYKGFANLDSEGGGPARFVLNGRTRYERQSFLEWLRSRITLPGEGPRRGRPKSKPSTKPASTSAQPQEKARRTPAKTAAQPQPKGQGGGRLSGRK